jgi:hypothetical protein
MKVWINGKKVGGDVSTNPTKISRTVGVAIDGSIPAGKEQYTGGVNMMRPVADIGEYLVNGENTIYIEYGSNLTNVQFSRIPALANHAQPVIYNWVG